MCTKVSQALLAILLVKQVVAVDQSSSKRPLILPASEYWHGNDGFWSSFALQIGSPAQTVYVLPGTSATAATTVWAILPEGCDEVNPDLQGCAEARGNLFVRNASKTWSTSRLANDGLYDVFLYEEEKLGLAANAYYGFDSVTLGVPGNGLPTLEEQTVACIATNDFFIGSLGLSPLSMNFTNLNDPVPSILGNLRSQNNSLVPSTTWAYTAGAAYKSPPVFGSLVFGGYDAKRVDLTQSVSIPFWADQSRDLLLGLQSLTYDTRGSLPLLTNGTYMFIDSLVSHMWLPTSVCQVFEKAFSLVLNETYELYLLDNATHASLRAQNPTFTFKIGASAESQAGSTTTISIPYAAFDLEISAPYFNVSQPYFPLKRAHNETQYTLGRVVLQEAYVIADYDRKNFTVGQALFPDRAAQDPVAIYAPGLSVEERHSESGLTTGAIAGIAIAAAGMIIPVIGLSWWLIRRRRRARDSARAPLTHEPAVHRDEATASVRQDHKSLLEADSAERTGELSGDHRFPEKAELLVSEDYRRNELADHASEVYASPVYGRY